MSKYQIIENKEGKKAIFDNETSQQVSEWWNNIEADMLLNGKSQYYIAMDDQERKAIFHIDNPNEPITQWQGWITPFGFLQGQSNYYIAYSKGKVAVFHISNPDQPVSQLWKMIYGSECLKGKSEYYLAQNQDKQWAIFHIDNPREPISNWYNDTSDVFYYNLLNGTTGYYATYNKSAVQIYHCTNKIQPVYRLPTPHKHGLLYLTNDFALYLTKQHLMMYDMRKMRNYVVSELPENMKMVLNHKYKGYKLYDINTEQTYQSINKFSSDNFIPILIRRTMHIFNEHSPYRNMLHIYLFTTHGKYIGEFENIQEMVNYIEQQQLARQNNNVDMLRLY